MSTEDLDAMTDRQLIGYVWLHAPGNPTVHSVDRLLRMRASQREAEGSANLVASTEKLVAATHRLGTMTVWLVVGTILMGLAAGADVLLKLLKVAH
jgi:hypothetical protein